MKKYILVGVFFIFVIVQPLFAFAEEEETLNLANKAKSAVLIERDTGEILFDKNIDEKLPPASMVKIMTLLLVMEAIDQGHLNLEEKIRVSERAASMGGSQVFLEAGEEMSVEDLVKAVAIASGNDASVALAERVSGSEEAFVQKMNEKVKKLGLEHTKFQNASGLPADDQYSTAYDMAMIAKELLKYEQITDYTSIYEDYLRKGKENEFWLVNTNKLVRFYPGVDGLKTGYTSEAKYCLTATAEKDGMRVISVVMGADTVKERNAMVSQMLDYAFNQFETYKLFDKGDVITEIELLKAENQRIPVVAGESISTLYKRGEAPEKVDHSIELKDPIELPIAVGEQIGTLTVMEDEKVLFKTPLTVSEEVLQASYLTLFKRTIQNMAKYK